MKPVDFIYLYLYVLPSEDLPCHLYHLRVYPSALLKPVHQLVRVSGHFRRCVRKALPDQLLRILKSASDLPSTLQDTLEDPYRPVHYRRGRLYNRALNRCRIA